MLKFSAMIKVLEEHMPKVEFTQTDINSIFLFDHGDVRTVSWSSGYDPNKEVRITAKTTLAQFRAKLEEELNNNERPS